MINNRGKENSAKKIENTENIGNLKDVDFLKQHIQTILGQGNGSSKDPYNASKIADAFISGKKIYTQSYSHETQSESVECLDMPEMMSAHDYDEVVRQYGFIPSDAIQKVTNMYVKEKLTIAQIRALFSTLDKVYKKINTFDSCYQDMINHLQQTILAEEDFTAMLRKALQFNEILKMFNQILLDDKQTLSYVAILEKWCNLNNMALINESTALLKELYHWQISYSFFGNLIEDYSNNNINQETHHRYHFFFSSIMKSLDETLNIAMKKIYEQYLISNTMTEIQLNEAFKNAKSLMKLKMVYPEVTKTIVDYINVDKHARVPLLVTSHLAKFFDVILQEQYSDLNENSVNFIVTHYIKSFVSNSDKGKEKMYSNYIHSNDIMISSDHMLKVLAIFKKIKNISSMYPILLIGLDKKSVKDFLSSKLLDYYLDDTKTSIDKINDDFDAFLSFIEGYHDRISLQKFSDLVDDHFRFEIQIQQLEMLILFEQKYPATSEKIAMNYHRNIHPNKNKEIYYYYEFITTISDNKYKNLSEKQVASIAEQYFNKWPKNEAQNRLKESLQKVVEVQAMSTIFSENEANYFFKTNQPEWQSNRVKVMQFLNHDLLNVNEEFKEAWFSKYKEFGRNILRSNNNTMPNRFKNLINYSREIGDSFKHPFCENQLRDKTTKYQMGKINLKEFSKFFYKKKHEYNASWRSKRDLAKSMFFELNHLSKTNLGEPISRSSYYQRCLEIIESTQELIIKDDYLYNIESYFKRNTKGYSRLYNICSEMFLAVSQEYLLDEHVSQVEKSRFFDTLLQKQLKTHIQFLFYYLKNDPSAKKMADTYFKPHFKLLNGNDPKLPAKPKDLAVLDVQINALLQKSNEIPEHLRYIIYNLSNLICSSNETAINNDNKVIKI